MILRLNYRINSFFSEKQKNNSINCKWSQWSPCSQTCGNGIESRQVEISAQFGGRSCLGDARRNCNLKQCSINCKWSQWSPCSVTCGNGFQSRQVEISDQFGGRSCLGESKRNCNVRTCPEKISLQGMYSITFNHLHLNENL